jgi:SPP1 family predicted phage head-tail adaptor
MKAPTIGELNTRITFQQAVSVSDATGGQTVTWQAFRTVWGAYRQIRGSEEQRGDVVRSHIRQHIIIRMQDGITATMRCVIAGVTYTILTVHRLDADGQWLVCALEREEGL